MVKCYNCGKEIQGEPTIFVMMKGKKAVCSEKCKRKLDGFLGMLLVSDRPIES
ncbi:MAG: hypothetical protein ACFFDI_13655 [Promethearchaeota archaeon]